MRLFRPGYLRTILLVTVCSMVWMDGISQYVSRPNRRYLGVEAGLGTRNFTIHSDIPAIHKMAIAEQGFSVGLMAGGDLVNVRLSVGSFKSSKLSRHEINLQEGGLSASVFPFQFVQKKSALLRPYGTLGINREILKFYGGYEIPVPPAPPAKPKECCGCICPPEPLPEPAQLNQETRDDSSYIGKINMTRLYVGAGVVGHLPGSTRFVNLFAEVRYGRPIGTKSMATELDRTKASDNLAITLGLTFGLRH
jgi:hypothetical protein